jgi:hypothetical protein
MALPADAHARLTLDGALPMPYHALLPYAQLNAVQSRVFDAAVSSSRSIAVAAPTGCGKTAIFDLAIVRLLSMAELDLIVLEVGLGGRYDSVNAFDADCVVIGAGIVGVSAAEEGRVAAQHRCRGGRRGLGRGRG